MKFQNPPAPKIKNKVEYDELYVVTGTLESETLLIFLTFSEN